MEEDSKSLRLEESSRRDATCRKGLAMQSMTNEYPWLCVEWTMKDN